RTGAADPFETVAARLAGPRFAAGNTDSPGRRPAGSGYSRAMLELAHPLGPTGAPARQLPGFTYRGATATMAETVADAVERGAHVAIEAGTGIGKTFAYLVPVLHSGRRVIISTGTRTLQDQLFSRDLPRLGRVFGRPVDVALLKGRNNYLCW